MSGKRNRAATGGSTTHTRPHDAAGRDTRGDVTPATAATADAAADRTNASTTIIETDAPARLDRLPWGRFHTLIVVALGITWLLDGLEVTLAGSVASALKTSPALHLSNTDIGLASSAYIVGAVLGALGFGWATDRLGRRKLFFVTLFLYVAATTANTRRSTRRFRSSRRHACAAGPTWRSTARSGSARDSARPARSCCSIPHCCRRTMAGACASSSARYSDSRSC
jgi:hypothetical protein